MAAERVRVAAMWREWAGAAKGSAGRGRVGAKGQHGADPQQPPASILLHELRKVFPSRDGNAEKVAVQVCRAGTSQHSIAQHSAVQHAQPSTAKLVPGLGVAGKGRAGLHEEAVSPCLASNM